MAVADRHYLTQWEPLLRCLGVKVFPEGYQCVEIQERRVRVKVSSVSARVSVGTLRTDQEVDGQPSYAIYLATIGP